MQYYFWVNCIGCLFMLQKIFFHRSSQNFLVLFIHRVTVPDVWCSEGKLGPATCILKSNTPLVMVTWGSPKPTEDHKKFHSNAFYSVDQDWSRIFSRATATQQRGKMFKKMQKKFIQKHTHPTLPSPHPPKKFGSQQILAKFGLPSPHKWKITSTTLNVARHNADKHSFWQNVS